MTILLRKLAALGAAAAMTALAACNLQTLNLDKEKDEAAREVYRLFNENPEKLRPRFGPELQGPELEAALPQFQALIPDAEPTSVRVAGWKTNWEAGKGEQLDVKHEYAYADRKIVASTVMTRKGKDQPWIINGFHIETLPLSGDAGGTPATPAKGGPDIRPAPGPTEPLVSDASGQAIEAPRDGDAAASSGQQSYSKIKNSGGGDKHASSLDGH